MQVKKRKRWPWLVLLAIVLIGCFAVWKIWNKPHRDVKDETGIAITATQLVKEYNEDEAIANKKYLDKAMLVNGVVYATGKDQDGQSTVSLQSGDLMSSVYCTLKKGEAVPATGVAVAIKGICTGKLSDVVIIDAVIDKQ